MKDTHCYQIGNNLYLNLTNRCSNRCTFCVRDQSAEYEGYRLWLQNGEPSVEEVIAEMGDISRYGEIVFCGYGEPTVRLDAVLELCAYIHAHGGRTRLNTNGHGNILNKKNIAPLLKGNLDGVNISLNAPTAEEYLAVCRPLVENAFEEVIAFGRACKQAGVNCWFSVVDCIGKDGVEACRRIAEEVGISLRIREMIDNRS